MRTFCTSSQKDKRSRQKRADKTEKTSVLLLFSLSTTFGVVVVLFVFLGGRVKVVLFQTLCLTLEIIQTDDEVDN